MKDNDVVVVIFSKEQVRHCKLAHFLKQFGGDALPEGPALAALMNRFRFLVHGYDDDPQELYAIPEYRWAERGQPAYLGSPQACLAQTSMASYLSCQVVYIAPTIPGISLVWLRHAVINAPSSSPS